MARKCLSTPQSFANSCYFTTRYSTKAANVGVKITLEYMYIVMDSEKGASNNMSDIDTMPMSLVVKRQAYR